MARTLRIAYEGATYHITLRGNKRQPIFRGDSDRVRFLESLEDRVDLFRIRLYAFALMTNHIHMVCETPLANISAFMQSLQTSYSTYFNKRYQEAGHVTQGRFGDKLVEEGAYLLQLCRYVHLNPVCTKAAKQLTVAERRQKLRAFKWSSYRSYISLENPLPYVDYEPMMKQVAHRAGGRRSGYRKFVEFGLAHEDQELEEAMKVSPLGIGSEGFVEQLSELHGDLLDNYDKREDVAFRRNRNLLAPDEILDVVAAELGVEPDAFKIRRRNSWLRAIAVRMLCMYGGLSQREAATVLFMGSGAAASHQIKELQEALIHDKELSGMVRGVEGKLRKLLI